MLLISPNLARADGRNPVGVIDAFHGAVKLKPANGGKKLALRLNLDFGKKLFAKDLLDLSNGAWLKYTIGRRQSTIRGPKVGYRIPQPRGVDSRQTDAMQFYARAGGRTRGGTKQIYQPAPDSTMMLEDFTIRWTPDPMVRQGTVTISAGATSVWTGPIGASNGSLRSKELTEALRQIQAPQSLTELLVTIEFSDGTRQESDFTLLSHAAEQEIEASLQAANKLSAGITRGLLRTAIFHKAGLLNSAAEELEATMRFAPLSVELLKATILAEQEIGNVSRVHQFNLKLAQAVRGKE